MVVLRGPLARRSGGFLREGHNCERSYISGVLAQPLQGFATVIDLSGSGAVFAIRRWFFFVVHQVTFPLILSVIAYCIGGERRGLNRLSRVRQGLSAQVRELNWVRMQSIREEGQQRS